jgi:hypothetical protein
MNEEIEIPPPPPPLPSAQGLTTEMDCRKLLLDFYSSEISTHGSLLIGFSIVIFTLVQIKVSLEPPIHVPQTTVLYLGILIANLAFWYVFFRYISYGTLADYTTRTPWKERTDENASMCEMEFFRREVSDYVRKKAQLKSLIKHFMGSSRIGFLIAMLLAILTTILLAVALDYAWFESLIRCLTGMH